MVEKNGEIVTLPIRLLYYYFEKFPHSFLRSKFVYQDFFIYFQAKPVLEYAALTIARTVKKLNLDGVDLVQKEGCGSTFVCGDLTSIQLNLLKQLRQNMPNKIISYTFPVDGNYIDFPYRDIVQWGQEYLNTITVYRANEEVINDLMFEMGVPRSKVSGVQISLKLILQIE